MRYAGAKQKAPSVCWEGGHAGTGGSSRCSAVAMVYESGSYAMYYPPLNPLTSYFNLGKRSKFNNLNTPINNALKYPSNSS